MILLNPNDYRLALPGLTQLPINHLFARAVIDKMVTGRIYVDNPVNPATFLIVHPYGMSLLLGNENNARFNAAFVNYALNHDRTRLKTEWLQAYPPAWHEKLQVLFKDNIITEEDAASTGNHNKLELSMRVNFSFNKDKYLEFKRSLDNGPHEIVRTDTEQFENIHGTVVPRHFWDNAKDFSRNGVAFSVVYDGKIASTAFSAFVIGRQLELGIESDAAARGKGFATLTCMALIDYCLENGYEPVWACRLQNTNSMRLATKLGFESTLYLPFYKLQSTRLITKN